jgi:hypothetical protein
VCAKLVADRRSDEISAIGVKTLVHQKIDMAKIDESEIDCDFLGVTRLVSQSIDFSSHAPSSLTIYIDGIWMVRGALQEGNLQKHGRRDACRHPPAEAGSRQIR